MNKIIQDHSKFKIQSIEHFPESVKLNWSDNHTSTFHYIWLRDNCSCMSCGRHESGSRFQSLMELPENIVPKNIEVKDDLLCIVWLYKNHFSKYTPAWLRAHCYSVEEKESRREKKEIWDHKLGIIPTVDFSTVIVKDSEKLALFRAVVQYGFVIVKNVNSDMTKQLADSLGYTRDTHFGLISDLMLRTSGTHVADYPTEILPHTDETYRDVPTGINIFHCIRPSEDGGGASILVDSFNCANILKLEDPSAFELLCQLPIRHERIAPNEIIRSSSPVFTLDTADQVSEVRLNERTMSALSLPEGLMLPAYSALRKAFKLAYDPANQIQYLMEPGDALVFDNLRLLHGRTAFKGKRMLRQTNVIRDEFFAKYNHLKES